MNLTFYLSIDRLPLGTAVAIEFAGPIAVAALGSRTRRDAGALALAAAGVVLLADVHLAAEPLGVALALSAGGLWSVYIVLGPRLAREPALRPGGGGRCTAGPATAGAASPGSARRTAWRAPWRAARWRRSRSPCRPRRRSPRRRCWARAWPWGSRRASCPTASSRSR